MNHCALPPYLASYHWYRLWAQASMRGLDDAGACTEAARQLALPCREFSRARVDGAAGRGEVMISVPLVGGASVAKRSLRPDTEISDHGRWNHVHAGAMESAYARTPYAPYWLDGMMSMILDYPRYMVDLNFCLHNAVLNAMDARRMLPVIASMQADNPDLLCAARDLGQRIRHTIEAGQYGSRSILGALMRYGPDTLLALVF